ncbi:MAG: LPS export ABC transporter permease LptG [Nitrospirae bacterium]|nr:MAG: LPS export ABC transporter permease LptG [Nitrospirota bacterium]
MGILFWYVLKQYVTTLVLCLTGVTSLYLIIDFFEKLRKFLRYDAELHSILLYFFFKIPDIFFQLAPFAALMATLLTVGLLNRNHEITAMRSCGLSLFQMTAPFFVVGFVLTLGLLGFTSVVIPLANSQAELIKVVDIQKNPKPLAFTANDLWLRLRHHAIMHIEAIDPDGARLRSIQLYRLTPSFEIKEIINARHASFTPDGWRLEMASRRSILPEGGVAITHHDHLPLELSLTPADLRTWIAMEPEHMTLHQLWTHITRLRHEGHNIAPFLTDFWARVAFPFVSPMMILLGLSLSLVTTSHRQMGLAKGIGQALVISFLFWTTHSVGVALGRSGALPPIAAGWIACVMFFIVSLNLFASIRY